MSYLIVVLILCGFFSAYVAARKGRSPVAWWFVGALLPGVGVIMSLAMPAGSPALRPPPDGQRDESRSPPRRRPVRCCGHYIPECWGCPHFRRLLFDSQHSEHARGRCEFFGQELTESPDEAEKLAERERP